MRWFLKDKQTRNLQNGNYIFDWMIIKNYTLLSEAVRNNLTGVFDQESLEVRPDGLYNPKYDMLNIHVYDHMANFKLTPESFKETYSSINEKYVYLTNKTLSAFQNSRKTLYIAYVLSSHHEQSDFINVLDSIKAQRADTNFLLLVLVTRNSRPSRGYTFDTLIEQNLCIHEIELYPIQGRHSRKGKVQWNRILDIFLSGA